jgi:hypothetical protein
MEHSIETKYFKLDRYVLKKMQYKQTWQYNQETQRWLLITGPPEFE